MKHETKVKMQWSVVIGLWRREHPEVVLERDGAFTEDHAQGFMAWANQPPIQGKIFLEPINIKQARAILANPFKLTSEELP